MLNFIKNNYWVAYIIVSLIPWSIIFAFFYVGFALFNGSLNSSTWNPMASSMMWLLSWAFGFINHAIMHRIGELAEDVDDLIRRIDNYQFKKKNNGN